MYDNVSKILLNGFVNSIRLSSILSVIYDGYRIISELKPTTLSVISFLKPLTIAIERSIIHIDNATPVIATFIAGELFLPNRDRLIRLEINHV